MILGLAVICCLLTGCGYSESADQRMLGLKGPVYEVKTTRTGADGKVMYETFTTFDSCGRVIEDPLGNHYSYAPSGEFAGGNHHYTTIERDADGRLTAYQDEKGGEGFGMILECDGELLGTVLWASDREDRTYTLEHDSKGRVSRLTVYTAWSGEQGAETYTETYTYTSDDSRGNWTERRVQQHAEVGYPAYNAATGTMETATAVSDGEFTDRREIRYHENIP